jgi:hypothetical protein
MGASPPTLAISGKSRRRHTADQLIGMLCRLAREAGRLGLSLQFQPRPTLGILLKLGRKNPKNRRLCKKSKYRRKRQPRQKPAWPNILVALIHGQPGNKEIGAAQNRTTVKGHTQGKFAFRATFAGTRIISP